MGFFGTTYGWDGKEVPIPKFYYTYPNNDETLHIIHKIFETNSSFLVK